jgi:hypothetical protein
MSRKSPSLRSRGSIFLDIPFYRAGRYKNKPIRRYLTHDDRNGVIRKRSCSDRLCGWNPLRHTIRRANPYDGRRRGSKRNGIVYSCFQGQSWGADTFYSGSSERTDPNLSLQFRSHTFRSLVAAVTSHFRTSTPLTSNHTGSDSPPGNINRSRLPGAYAGARASRKFPCDKRETTERHENAEKLRKVP